MTYGERKKRRCGNKSKEEDILIPITLQTSLCNCRCLLTKRTKLAISHIFFAFLNSLPFFTFLIFYHLILYIVDVFVFSMEPLDMKW